MMLNQRRHKTDSNTVHHVCQAPGWVSIQYQYQNNTEKYKPPDFIFSFWFLLKELEVTDSLERKGLESEEWIIPNIHSHQALTERTLLFGAERRVGCFIPDTERVQLRREKLLCRLTPECSLSLRGYCSSFRQHWRKQGGCKRLVHRCSFKMFFISFLLKVGDRFCSVVFLVLCLQVPLGSSSWIRPKPAVITLPIGPGGHDQGRAGNQQQESDWYQSC